MVMIRQEKRSDVSAREALLDAAFGKARFHKASERLREGRRPADGLSFVAVEDGRVVGTVRLWHVTADRRHPALLLGPLAVDAAFRKHGIGAALMWHALRKARQQGCRAVILVGDAPYYGRFGFSADKTDALWLPGPYDPARLLACEFVPGALKSAQGLIAASSPPELRSGLAVLVPRSRLRNPAQKLA